MKEVTLEYDPVRKDIERLFLEIRTDLDASIDSLILRSICASYRAALFTWAVSKIGKFYVGQAFPLELAWHLVDKAYADLLVKFNLPPDGYSLGPSEPRMPDADS